MNSTQTKTQLSTDQFVIFTPHNEQLKNDLLSRKVDNVVVSTISTDDKVTDIIYLDFIFCDDRIQARVEERPSYSLVCFLEDDETIESLFKGYDGEIYHTIDQLDILSKTKSQLAEIRGKYGENAESVGEITVITVSNSKDNKGIFRYIRCIGNKYENTKSVFKSVTFHISRCGKYQHRIDFAVPVTERRAINAAENFLSGTLYRKYYNLIADDLFHKRLPWVKAMKQYKCRGDCLTGSRFIGGLTSVDGHIEFS